MLSSHREKTADEGLSRYRVYGMRWNMEEGERRERERKERERREKRERRKSFSVHFR
jgi:hypothetical protein